MSPQLFTVSGISVPFKSDTVGAWPNRETRKQRSLPKVRAFAATAFLLIALCPHGLQAQSGDQTPSHLDVAEAGHGTAGSPYIPLDSWIYPAAIRLYDLGYLPTAFLGLRPWTRVSLAHMLSLSQNAILESKGNAEALEIFDRLHRELEPELADASPSTGTIESIYTRVRGIEGNLLNDSFHLGQTIVNDYGRPYQPGFNNLTGFSGWGTSSRFNLYVRAEYQRAPSAMGYSAVVANQLAVNDGTPQLPQFGIPQGPIRAQSQINLVEADVSTHVLGHQFSFGKSDAWLGPAQGASMAWSNNAENIYSFRIDRIEPLYIPGLSKLIGLVRYDFFVGSLKHHNYPADPWIHSEKFSFKPTPDLEFGFQRSVIWGGIGHVPITTRTFLRSFFSPAGVQPDVKMSRADPGARFSTFDFTWRLPWKDHLITVYTDSLVHDNVFPISNPGRAGLRPGIYISRLPSLPHVDLRIEGAETDPNDPGSVGGSFLYAEFIQKQGYTNKSQIIGDWIGREGKGGQAWLTWHMKADQFLQLEYRTAKAASDFIPGGTTQQALGAALVFRPLQNLEVKALAQGELWRAPLIANGTQRNFVGSVQLTYFPKLRF